MRDFRTLFAYGIHAIVDLAIDERPLIPPREMVYCRFPLTDGAGTPRWMLRMAIVTTAELVRSDVATVAYCSAGMSRSPAIAAAALALVTGEPTERALSQVVRGAPADVSPTLWAAVCEVLVELRAK